MKDRGLLGGNDVLIDTWWNVNYNNVRAVEMVKAVLIDTWWNVNLNCVV